MMSLNQRILFSTTLVLLIFIIGIAVTLDRAFHDSAYLGVEDRLLARLLLLMSDAELDEQGILHMPSNLLDTELSRPDSGTYAFIIDQTKTITWRSNSALNKQIPEQAPLAPLEMGTKRFEQIVIGEKPHFIYSYGVTWIIASGTYPITFTIVADTILFDAQIERYREDLWGWLSIMALLLLITQMLVLRWGLHPMRQVSSELAANKFAPRALHLSPRQDRGVLRRRKPKTARYADFKNTNYNAPRGKTTGNRKLKLAYKII